MLYTGLLFAVMAGAAACCPQYANVLAGATALIATATFDPLNDGGQGYIGGDKPEASLELVAYGAFPFVYCSVVMPRLDILVAATIGHSVRRRCACHKSCGTARSCRRICCTTLETVSYGCGCAQRLCLTSIFHCVRVTVRVRRRVTHCLTLHETQCVCH